jgi:hypothetical protein
MADNFASIEGDDLVIRVPIDRLEEIMADVPRGSMLGYPVTIQRKDAFLAKLVAGLNGSNAVECMLTCEIDELVENRSRSVHEHRPRRKRAA